MTKLFAQPYSLDAIGFYFESEDEFQTITHRLVDAHGERVEEFEIQFIDGEDIDAALAKAIGLSQGNIGLYLDAVDVWNEEDKRRYIIGVGEYGLEFDLEADDPNELDVDVYHLDSLRELAEQLVKEGVMGDILESMRFYFDYDVFARDLAMDYSETEIAGQRLIYRVG